MIFKFGRKEAAPETLAPTLILPSDVRYALQYKEAKLSKHEVVDLAQNGFAQEAFYMLLKLSSTDHTLQERILSELVLLIREQNEKTTEDDLGTFITAHVGQLPSDAVVDAMKLSQYSRQGFELWRSKFREHATLSAERNNPTYLVGHSMCTGLLDSVKEHSRVGKDLHILMPDQIMANDLQSAGYTIRAELVVQLPKDFDRENDAIITDDVQNTGDTERLIREFWTKDGSTNPEFEYLSVSK